MLLGKTPNRNKKVVLKKEEDICLYHLAKHSIFRLSWKWRANDNVLYWNSANNNSWNRDLAFHKLNTILYKPPIFFIILGNAKYLKISQNTFLTRDKYTLIDTATTSYQSSPSCFLLNVYYEEARNMHANKNRYKTSMLLFCFLAFSLGLFCINSR